MKIFRGARRVAVVKDYICAMLFRAVLFLALCIFVSCGTGNTNVHNDPDTIIEPPKIDSVRKNLRYPKLMNIVRQSAYDNYLVRIGNVNYTCSYKGVCESSDTNGAHVKYLFDLKAEYLIDAVYLQPLSGDRFFVAWQETDHTGVKSHFAVYKVGQAEPVWRRMESAPSPGQPVLDSTNVYISSLGMIAKVNIDKGETVWEHDSLFDPYKLTYKKFNKPILYTHTACFFDFTIRGKKNKVDTIWVNEATGKIGR